LETGINDMSKARFVSTNRVFTLLSFLSVCALGACGSSPEGQTTDAPEEGAYTTESYGARLPAAGTGSSSTSAPAANDPQPGSPAAEGAAAAGVAAVPMPYRGINLAGAEFGNVLPGVDGRDYWFPTQSQIDYYLSKGMNTFRIGFKWERLQKAAYGELDATYGAKLSAIVSYATAKGATVILNPHNFARYYNQTVGSSQVPSAVFADFWRRLSSQWVSTPNVMFNLVNEPNTMATEQWVDAANEAITAIRSTGATNPIVVPGNNWTGAHSWSSSTYGTPNSVALLNIVDPGNNVIFEAHQYMDPTSGGSSEQCVSTTIGSERLAPFVKWLRDNKLRGMVGELAGARNQTCYTAVQDMLSYMMKNTDVLVGWQWWAGGPRWGSYKFTLEPEGGVDQPQMAVIAPFLAR
jgi:endoglucanase